MNSICIISDLTSGGAAIACRRLFSGLKGCGLSAVKWLSAVGSPSLGATVASQWPDLAALARCRIIRKFSSSAFAMRMAECVLNERNIQRIVAKIQPDVINLHNLHESMTFSLLERLPTRTPIVWTLHDMWPLTGYCCYSYDCRKYLDGCRGVCPQVGKWGQATAEADRAWRVRDRWFRANLERVTFVCPSRWLARCASERLGPDAFIETIPYGLDTDMFQPISESAGLCQALGLPKGSGIILTGAQSLDQECKGTSVLVEAIRLLREQWGKDITVVAFGARGNVPKSMDGWLFTGSISDEQLLNLYYNAADVFVAPSLADNLPNVLLEATAAGSLCVSTDAGGCPEIVRHEVTGFVARLGDAGDLAGHIDRALRLSPSVRIAMKQAARAVAVKEYALEVQAARMEALYSRVMVRCNNSR